MSHLLYSSNEMYSSTELIRKSKTIFNKILNNEIDKAIILRDGKPSFMLLDFDKYEKIMAEYDELKASSSLNNNTNSNTSKQKKISTRKKLIEPAKIEKSIIEEIPTTQKDEVKKIIPAKVVPPTPIYIEEDEPIENEEDIIIAQDDSEQSIQEISENEVKQGLEVLDDLDFDDEFKKEVERKVRERKSREVVQNVTQQEVSAESKNEIEKKKKTELKEFWA